MEKFLTLFVFLFINRFFITLAFSDSSSKKIYLEEVYVLGNYQEKNYYSNSYSATVLSAEDFKDQQATHFEEMINTVPNLSGTKGSSRTRFFTIRGVGERSSYEGMPISSVGIMIDDIDYTSIGGISDLGAIEQVEVYKGPQAVRMGPSALAGMIHMTSKIPTKKTSARALFSVESYNTFKEQVNLSSSISKKLSTSLSISKTDSDGYMKNTFLNQKDTSSLDELSVRSKSALKTEKLDATLSIHYHDFNNGYDFFNQENSLKTKSDKPGEDDQKILAASVKLEYGNVNLKYVTVISHLDENSFYSYDEDWGNNIFWNQLPGYNANYDYNIEFTKGRRHYYIDQRFILKKDLLVGVYYKNSYENFKEQAFEDELERKNVYGDYNTENSAFYIQNTMQLSSRHFIDYGVRFENRTASYNDSLSNSFSPSENMSGGSISYRIQNDAHNMNFISLSKGFKAGGFNTQSNIEQSRREFEQESIYNLEVGTKKVYAQNLVGSFTLFYMQREDIQVRTSYQDDPQDPSSYTFYTDNATSGSSYGLELEMDYFLSPKVEIQTNLSLLKTSYDTYVVGETNIKGREFPNAPAYTLNTILRYQVNDEFYFLTNLYFSDTFYFSNSHNQKHPKYELVDMTIGYNFKNWDISLWCKNIFNEESYARGFFFANRPPDWQNELYTQRNPPQITGLSTRYQF